LKNIKIKPKKKKIQPNMPKGSKAGVRKECDACAEQIPVACKTCPECNHELIPERKDSVGPSAVGESVTTVSEEIVPDLETDKTEKRRSVRAKRDKPDYYDALDYDSKRAKAIKGGGTTPKRGPPGSFGSSRISPGGKVRRQVGFSSFQQQTRATLSWRKEDDEENAKKKGKKTNGNRKDEVDDAYDYIDEIPSDKLFSCAVSLAEINRKLGIVMWKPTDLI